MAPDFGWRGRIRTYVGVGRPVTGLFGPYYRVSRLLQPLGYTPVKPVSWVRRRLNRASDRVAQ